MTFENEAEMPNARTHVVSMQRHGFMFLIVALTILAFVINRFWAMRIKKSIVTPLDILADGVAEISNMVMDNYELVCYQQPTIWQFLNKSNKPF